MAKYAVAVTTRFKVSSIAGPNQGRTTIDAFDKDEHESDREPHMYNGFLVVTDSGGDRYYYQDKRVHYFQVTKLPDVDLEK